MGHSSENTTVVQNNHLVIEDHPTPLLHFFFPASDLKCGLQWQI